MIRLGLHHFETLAWIARLGSFRAAAERLNTTQPAISARIKEMESQLQAPLFRREGRGVVLTPLGQHVVRECEPLLAGFSRVLLDATGRTNAVGLVRIGMGEIAAAGYLPRFVGELRRHLPRVTLDIELDLTSKMLQNLQSGQSDIVFVAGPVSLPGVLARSIGGVRLVWVCSPQALRNGGVVDLPVWSVSRNSPIFDVMMRWMDRFRADRAQINRCNNINTIINILLRGEGIALLPENMIAEHVEEGLLVEALPAPDERIDFQSCIRAAETDPLILDVFERSGQFRVDGESGAAAGAYGPIT